MLLSPPPPPPGFTAEPARAPRPSTGTDARIWLVRHGRVNAATQAYGDADVPLSDEGLAQSRAVARSFADAGDREPVRAVVCSPLVRALAMGEAIADATGAALTVDERLKELWRGDWQGLERREYHGRWTAAAAEYWSDTLGWRGHGGESEAGLVERVWPAFRAAVSGVEGGTVVIAAHRQVIRALVAAALGLPPGRSHALRLDPAHGVLLVDTPVSWTMERCNIGAPGSPHAARPKDGPPADVITRE